MELSEELGTLCPAPLQCLLPATAAATPGGATAGHVLPVTGWPWDGRTGTLAPTPPAPPKTGSGQTLPLPDCHVGVSADWEQSLHSQSVLEPSANKSIARSLETHFPVFYLGFHCLCTCVNDVNSSSIDTG